ncbi:hypothetical protein [uncultured Campylobacter sp.]|nr:hypothetical protein [uncultured Campylobacter sp.]
MAEIAAIKLKFSAISVVYIEANLCVARLTATVKFSLNFVKTPRIL